MLASQQQAGAAESSTFSERTKTSYSDSNPRIRQLIDWFTSTGGLLHPNVRVVQDEAGSFHVIAAQDLVADGYQLVAKGSIRSTLSYLNLDHSQDAVTHVNSCLQKLLGKVPSHVLTYLLLVEQRMLGDRSPWQHYIACLPRQEVMTTPLFFSEEDGEYMKGTPVYNSLSAQGQAISTEWENARSAMAEAGLTNEPIYEACDRESYLWAVTIITSRAFISQAILPTLPKFSLLFPVIDLLDHSPTAKAEWDFAVNDSFSLRISQTFHAGTELFNNYGPKHNGELLYGYGFAVPDNPVEQIHLKVRFGESAQQQLSALCTTQILPFALDPQHCQAPFDDDILIRPRGSPLGRYQNRVPCLGACPPQFVLSNYLAALQQRGRQPGDVPDPSYPGARITLATIKPFYAFIKRRYTELASSRAGFTAPQNERQRQAAIYRDGQLKVAYNIHTELNGLLRRVRSTGEVQKTGLITTTEALKALQQESREHYENFKTGVRAGWPEFDVDEDIEDLVASGEEHLIWAILLVVLNAVARTSPIINPWLEDLQTSYPIPSQSTPDEEDEEASLLTQIIASAAAMEDETWTVVAALPDLDAVISWALHVVRCEMIELPDLQHPQWERHCLYVSDGSPGSDEWLLQDVEVEHWTSLQLPS